MVEKQGTASFQPPDGNIESVSSERQFGRPKTAKLDPDEGISDVGSRQIDVSACLSALSDLALPPSFFDGWEEVLPKNLSVGDRIKIVCPTIKDIFRTDFPVLDGRVLSLFDAVTGSASFWQIELQISNHRWWLYEPSRYGGFMIRRSK